MIAIFIPGEPVAFARSGHNGGQHYTPAKQRAYMASVALLARRAMGGREPMRGALKLTMRATYAVPQSWTRAERATVEWKTSRPDADNLAKIVEDACNGLVWIDDAQVADLHVQKRFGTPEGVTVEVSPIEAADLATGRATS